MGKKKMTPVSMALGALILVVVAFMVRGSLRQPEKIVLPPEPTESEGGGETAGEEIVRRVEVRPDTVQSVIAALTRPPAYTRTVTIERYWDGGSGVSTVTVSAADGWMRLDASSAGAQARHIITDGETTWIWYGGSRRYISAASVLSQDAEQGIPTYEEVLSLPIERIAAADYRALESVNCIYVETAPDERGYTDRYWVSVDTGLLVAAERTQNETVVYRMAALSAELGGTDAEDFTLPDGTVLYEPAVTAAKESGKTEEG